MKDVLRLAIVLVAVSIAVTDVVAWESLDERCDRVLQQTLHGSPAESAECAVELERMATDGHARSQYWLALCLAAGTAMDRDVDQANYWMKTSAENGFIEAQARWGLALLSGESGVQIDYEAAKRWLSLAAEHEEPDALAGLGHMYLAGLGVDEDTAKGLEYYKRSAELGCEEAQISLRRFRTIRWRLSRFWRSYWPYIVGVGVVLLLLCGNRGNGGYLSYDDWIAAGSPSAEGRLNRSPVGGCLLLVILGVIAYSLIF